MSTRGLTILQARRLLMRRLRTSSDSAERTVAGGRQLSPKYTGQSSRLEALGQRSQRCGPFECGILAATSSRRFGRILWYRQQVDAFPASSRLQWFVGREAELAVLTLLFDAATQGRGSIALIAGEPGIGKTRLMEELAAVAGGRGARVLWGRCYEGDGAPAFCPWVQLLRAYVSSRTAADLSNELGTWAPEIAALVPELYSLIPGLLTVTTQDFSFDVPSITAGQRSIQVVNQGPRRHEMALLKLAPDASPEQVQQAAQNGDDQTPFATEPAGGVAALAHGATGWATVDFTPGPWMFVCYMPDAASGVRHAALGMSKLVLVEAAPPQ